jgi:AcrR family transcriptional regulator
VDKTSIIEASRTLFRDHGFHGTSMRDIAAALGTATSSVYNHFGSKDDILFAVLERPIIELQEQVDAALRDQVEPLYRLLAAYSTHIRYHLENQLDAQIVQSEYAWLQGENRSNIMTMRRNYQSTFEKLVQDCMDAGAFRKDDAAVVAKLLVALPASMTRWYVPSGRLSGERMLRLVLDFVCLGIAGDTFAPHYRDWCAPATPTDGPRDAPVRYGGG